jgi:hypothetical protein
MNDEPSEPGTANLPIGIRIGGSMNDEPSGAGQGVDDLSKSTCQL